MNINGIKTNSVFEHTFNDSVVATTKLMENLMTQTNDGQFLRIAPNVFLYFSPNESKGVMITSTPLHYFYGSLDIEPDENSNTEVTNSEPTSENEDSNSDDNCDSNENQNDDNNVLIDNQNIDLAHNLINIDNIPNVTGNSVSTVIPLCSDDLINESKDVEGKIKSKYNGQIFRHNDTMFTHIRPDGTIDRVITDSTGHNCTSYR